MSKRHHSSALTAALWVAAILWIGVLFFLSTQSGVDSSALSGWFTGIVLHLFRFLHLQPAALEPALRKLAHFGIFAVEGFLLTLAMMRTARRLWRGALAAALSCALMAAANEYSQRFADGRSCELRDMLIDSGGALLGLLAVLALRGLIRAHRRRRRA